MIRARMNEVVFIMVAFPLSLSSGEGMGIVNVNTYFLVKARIGIREAVYLNFTAASSIGNPVL